MQQDTLIEKALRLGQALTIGATFVLSPVSFASAATTLPQRVQLDTGSSSLSTAVLERDYSADIRRARKELVTAHLLLVVLGETVEVASLAYVDRLGDIIDAAMGIASDKLPEYSRFLADRLQSVRAELLESVECPKTWSVLSKIINPGTRPALPERFISHRPAKPVELPVPELRAAAYLRSSKGPRTV